MKISYFFHDVGHADLARRCGMLREGGAETMVFGFRRTQQAEADLAEAVVDLGRTADARFLQRVWSVARVIPRLRQWADKLRSSNVILARNLEMLVLAAIARRLHAPRAALVYECLDIHRLMLSNQLGGAILRRLERMLLNRSQGLMVSSPAFIREYFQPIHRALPRTFVVENKVFPADETGVASGEIFGSGPPWRIGWFGVLRCRRSLEMLSLLLRSAPGMFEVVVAGVPASGVFEGNEKAFAGISGLTFLGAYKGEAAHARLFRSVHFIWAIDYYDAGGNSNWLLPNRLYRAALYGAVPVTLAGVETGKWLACYNAGILLDEPAEEQLLATMRSITPQSFAAAKAAIERIPKTALITQAGECQDLVVSLGELGRSFGESGKQ
jgi:succinoglycan biosynthesis protein ExoL